MIPFSEHPPEQQRRMGLAAAGVWISFAQDVQDDPVRHEVLVQNAIRCLMVGSHAYR